MADLIEVRLVAGEFVITARDVAQLTSAELLLRAINGRKDES